ncbi:hypothetical protein A6V36_33920 [Paraburkholderia ginsengiterrae]|uniref:Uncharacterized protein n=1 Tax=Paraburkholderia ginsengiterrae TaxID=1462993 RepID=A0A1A9N973_9BURK|nr:hypothetical protein A6V36_33920 [Paraburkholderia ginsengiterrae]OAJ61557.1 hypothetical protein A6V37_24695 [Paraburkholderia ginsengiterrae]
MEDWKAAFETGIRTSDHPKRFDAEQTLPHFSSAPGNWCRNATISTCSDSREQNHVARNAINARARDGMIRNPPGDNTVRNDRVTWLAQTSNRIANFEFSGMTGRFASLDVEADASTSAGTAPRRDLRRRELFEKLPRFRFAVLQQPTGERHFGRRQRTV